MKNRFIYLLMSLMLIALVGIISIQVIWIKGSIDERQRTLNTQVNDALNALNEEIHEEESLVILERRFGDVDSLMNTIVFADSLPTDAQIKIQIGNTDQVITSKDDDESVIVFHEKPKEHSVHIEQFDGLTDSMVKLHEEMEDLHTKMGNWTEDLEVRLEELDSTVSATIEANDLASGHLDHITDFVEHYTFEMLLGDKLKDRLNPGELKKKIRNQLDEAGVSSSFEFAVNNEDGYLDDFQSQNFDTASHNNTYTKQLFQNDRRKGEAYLLNVQLNESGSYIWSGVSSMAILSIVFTLLILLTFAYALRLIFKQKKISQIKNDFINNMTHELKTPLASISLASSSIRHPQVINNPEEIKKFTEVIDSERSRMKSHIDRVLEIAKLDSGDIELKLEEIDLVEAVNSALTNVELSIKEVNGEIQFEHDPAPLLFQGDSFHLTNVFTNVLDNSIKYRNGDLRIHISVSTDEEFTTITFTDNGIGMSPQEQKLAFDKFYRAESGDIHNIKGFGLGLSYVKSIIEKHNGTIDLTSATDQGTSIKIKLPKR